jgi:hypothetical protein
MHAADTPTHTDRPVPVHSQHADVQYLEHQY